MGHFGRHRAWVISPVPLWEKPHFELPRVATILFQFLMAVPSDSVARTYGAAEKINIRLTLRPESCTSSCWRSW